MSTPQHHQRKHSKYSASGAERWFNCQGSVKLSEGMPDVDTIWSVQGTQGHEALEQVMEKALEKGMRQIPRTKAFSTYPQNMVDYAVNAANFILGLSAVTPRAEVLVETRIHLDFIHPEMFGTFDAGIVDIFGTLHVFDYKYGAGHSISAGTEAKPNFQMLFYGIGLAHLYDWNFEKVKLWIIQPRIKGYDGPVYLGMPIQRLSGYVKDFERAVERVERYPDKYVEGSWCHWCKAKTVCPLKKQAKLEKAISVFKDYP